MLNNVCCFQNLYASMVKLADTRDLGSRAERRAGSTPVTSTTANGVKSLAVLLFGGTVI